MRLQITDAHEELHGLKRINNMLLIMVRVFIGVAFVDSHAKVEGRLHAEIELAIKVVVFAYFVKEVANAVILHLAAVFDYIEAYFFPVLAVRAAECLVKDVLAAHHIEVINFC